MNNKFVTFVGGMVAGAYVMYNHLFKKIAKAAIKTYENKLTGGEEAETEE